MLAHLKKHQHRIAIRNWLSLKSISYASSYYRTVIPCTTAFLGMGWYTLRRLMSPQLRWMFNGHQWWAIAFLPGNLTAFGFNRIFPERRHLHGGRSAPFQEEDCNQDGMGWDTPKYNRIRLKFQMSARHSSLFVFWLLQLLHLILINSQCNMARDGTVQ